MSDFSNHQIRAARLLLEKDGWVVPPRRERLLSLIVSLKLQGEVLALADKLADCEAALQVMERHKRDRARTLSAIRREAGRGTYAGTVKALGMAEDATLRFPGDDELSRLSTFLESKLLLNSF